MGWMGGAALRVGPAIYAPGQRSGREPMTRTPRLVYGGQSVAIPLNDDDRSRIIATIAKLATNIRGHDVPRLVDLVEAAIFDFSPDLPTLEKQRDAAMATDLGKAILRLSIEAAKLYPTIGSYGPAPDRLYGWVNPFSSAILAIFPYALAEQHASFAKGTQTVAATAAEMLRFDQQMRETDRAPSDNPQQEKRAAAGPGEDLSDEPIGRLVRAVCLYIYEQDLPLDLWWKTRIIAKRELDAAKHTGTLLIKVRDEFGFAVPNKRLRGHLIAFGKILRSEFVKPDPRRPVRSGDGRLRGHARRAAGARYSWLERGGRAAD